MIRSIKLQNRNNKKRKLYNKSFLFLLFFLLNFICNRDVLSQTATTFTDVTSIALVNNSSRGMGAAWGDYDNDGLIDLYVSNYKDENILYKNTGNDTFSDITDFANVGNTGASTDIAWGDYNNDGFLDLFLVNGLGPGYGDKKVLYKNSGDGTFENIAEKGE
ncbi:MAG: VCBS repeat-containing protein [Candidatus Kuenenia sp.]|nr:VCBS repeat-containing protein [Candidatus Kuenenia hertensis]